MNAPGLFSHEEHQPSARQLAPEAVRQVVALRLAAPKRGEAGRAIVGQEDCSGLALFAASDQGRLV